MSARLLLGACAAVGSVILVTGVAGAAPGDLDPTFGTGGAVAVPIATYGAGSQGSAVQADNKLLLVGTNFQMAPPPPPPAPHGVPRVEDEDFYALRLTQDGGVDTSFGSNGIVRTPIDLDPGARDLARGVSVGPDGKIVVVGDAWRTNQDSQLALVRYTAAGALDPTFSDDGIQTIDLGPESVGYAVVVQPDGRAVAVGNSPLYPGFQTVRLNVDGTLDPSFGADGIVRTPIGDPSMYDASSVVALDGARIVVAGIADGTNQSSTAALARYLPDGQLDQTFGNGGVVLTPALQPNGINAIAVTSEGKIVAAGSEGTPSTGSVIWMARYLPDGALDTTFGGTGIVTTAIGTYAGANSLVLQPDGKAVVGGGNSFSLVRYNEDGSLDTSFGDGGVATYPFWASGGAPTSVLIQHLAEGRVRLVQTGTEWVGGGEFAAIGVRLDGVATPPPPPPVPPPPVPPPPVPPPPPARYCVVPRVTGQTLARAKARIRARGCSLGRVRRVHARQPRGRVVGQKPRAGLRKSFRTRVSLTVSRGLVLVPRRR